jgi:hypothetical protein
MRVLLIIWILWCILPGAGDLYAQVPANDDCWTAQNLGSLPTPAACPGGGGNALTVNGSNVGATASNPYPYMIGCQPNGNQSSNGRDVWYQFTATGTFLNINISGSLATPNVGLWLGSCGALQGLDCAIGNASGNLSVSIPIVSGQTYYLQISGDNATSTGSFTLSLDNDLDCNNCLQEAFITVSPAPVNGTLFPRNNGQFLPYDQFVDTGQQQLVTWCCPHFRMRMEYFNHCGQSSTRVYHQSTRLSNRPGNLGMVPLSNQRSDRSSVRTRFLLRQ